jgi:peptide-O-fucosyltransferase
MASPQCLDDRKNAIVTGELCLPSKATILKDLETVLLDKLEGNVTNIYIATDQYPMIDEIKNYFKNRNLNHLNIVHHDPWLPIIDLAILGRSEWFIGNCISSFTSFVIRERNINEKRSSFWGES